MGYDSPVGSLLAPCSENGNLVNLDSHDLSRSSEMSSNRLHLYIPQIRRQPDLLAFNYCPPLFPPPQSRYLQIRLLDKIYLWLQDHSRAFAVRCAEQQTPSGLVFPGKAERGDARPPGSTLQASVLPMDHLVPRVFRVFVAFVGDLAAVGRAGGRVVPPRA